MIDIHTHILPGIDDGAKKGEQSKEMLLSELSQGVKTVVLTPHYYGRQRSPEQFLERRAKAFANLKEYLPDGLEMRLGAEIYFSGVNTAPHEELCKLCIQGTKYVLFEFPFNEKWTSALWERLAEFIRETDYTPIIAHVERYMETIKQPQLLRRLADMGCLMQVNTTAFLDRRSRSFAFALLKHGWVHCLGSDAHDTQYRACDYATAKAAIEKAGCYQAFETAQENMRRILSGERVYPQAGTRLKKFLGFYY